MKFPTLLRIIEAVSVNLRSAWPFFLRIFVAIRSRSRSVPFPGLCEHGRALAYIQQPRRSIAGTLQVLGTGEAESYRPGTKTSGSSVFRVLGCGGTERELNGN